MNLCNNKEYKKLINDFMRKSEILRNAHYMLSCKYRVMNNVLHFLTLVFASIVAILTFADVKDFAFIFPELSHDLLRIFLSSLASFVFLLTVIDEFLPLANKVTIHESSGKQFTAFIRELSVVKEKKTLTDEDIDNLKHQYIKICESTPSIPDRVFLKSKLKLFQKIAISKEIDNNPFMSITLFKIKKRFLQASRIEKNFNHINVNYDVKPPILENQCSEGEKE